MKKTFAALVAVATIAGSLAATPASAQRGVAAGVAAGLLGGAIIGGAIAKGLQQAAGRHGLERQRPVADLFEQHDDPIAQAQRAVAVPGGTADREAGRDGKEIGDVESEVADGRVHRDDGCVGSGRDVTCALPSPITERK